VFAPYGYYRPKLGWGALGGPGGLGGIGDFGQEDNTPAYSPPSGWGIALGPVLVTESNRSQFGTASDEAISSCGLSSVAVLVGGVYVPPVGWYAATIERNTGEGEWNISIDTVWINPAGGSYQIYACGGGSTGSAGGSGKDSWSPLGSDLTGLLVVGGVVVGGILLWKAFSKK
jgi:hypothetical protein